MPTRTLIPSPEQLRKRLADTELQLAELQALLAKKLTQAQRAGAMSHVASLTQRRTWYLARLRSTSPIQALGVEVGDDISLREAHP